jgi:3-oxoadipate enol-lactonase
LSILPANGEQIHYDMGGSGRPVIFLHSLGLDGTVWRPQVCELPDGICWVSIDLRGHGRSSAKGRITVDAMASDVLALMDSLGIRNATLVGCSMGGLVAQELVIRAPERVTALLLCNTFAKIAPSDAADRVAAREAQAAAGTLTPRARARVLVSDAPASSKDLFIESAARMDAANLFAAQEQVYQVDFVQRLAPVRCPTLIVAGSADVRTPMPMLTQLQDAIRGSELHVIDGAGHVSHLDRPAEFNKELRAFLLATAST